MINVRKLAALDLQILGPKLILVEFGLGVVGCVVLGALTLRAGIERFHSWSMVLGGLYRALLGMNYLPLLLHAISMASKGNAREAIAGELDDRRTVFGNYRRQSLFLLLPLVVIIAAIAQEIQRRQQAK